MKPDNTERNNRIIALSDTMSAGKIEKTLLAEFPDITRNVVIGVIKRHGPKDPQSLAKRASLGRGQHRDAIKSRVAKQEAQKAAPTRSAPAIPAPPARKMAPTPPDLLPRGSFLQTPLSGSTPVPADQRSGCVWPFGERENITFCNLPKCRVLQNGVTRQTNYCAGHWDARRTTQHTRIIAEPA